MTNQTTTRRKPTTNTEKGNTEMAKPKELESSVTLEAQYNKARESFSGRLLANNLFADFEAVAGIVDREIHHSGSFKEKVSDYAYALSRTQRFDAAKAEEILRDIYYQKYGQSMNQTRLGLLEREEKLGDEARGRALGFAAGIETIVEKGDKVTFNRALAAQAEHYGDDLGITHVKARGLMAEAFEAAQGKSIYDWGKELDERFFRAQVDAEKVQRNMVEDDGASQPHSSGRFRGRSGPSH